MAEEISMNKSFDNEFPVVGDIELLGWSLSDKYIYTGGLESDGNAVLVKCLTFPIKSQSNDWMEW